MLFTSLLQWCAHMHARTQTHTHRQIHVCTCCSLHTNTFNVHQWGYIYSSKLAWAVSCHCREVHNDNYSLGLYPWINQIRHTHTIQKCQGLLWCMLTGVQCWSSPVLGSGPLYHCSLLKPPGNDLSKIERLAGPIKLQSNQQRVRKPEPLTVLPLCNSVSLSLRKTRWECVEGKLQRQPSAFCH